MKTNQDAFGQELYDFYCGEKTYGIYERDDGAVNVAGNAYYFSEYKDWPPSIRKALRYAKGTAVDIGCGAARIALYLQSKGLDVIGIDISPLAIKVSRLRGLKKAKVMSITEMTRSIGKFDTLVMLGNNFGLLGSPKQAERLLKRFFQMTSPNARIIAQTLDPYNTKDKDKLDYHRLNRRRNRMPGQIRLRSRYKTLVSPWFDYLYVSRKEMKQILIGTGWHVKRFISDAKGPNYIAIIEKEKI